MYSVWVISRRITFRQCFTKIGTVTQKSKGYEHKRAGNKRAYIYRERECERHTYTKHGELSKFCFHFLLS